MTKRTGRKILSLLCTLTVLLGLMSVIAISSSADGATVPGPGMGRADLITPHTGTTTASWTPFTFTNGVLNSGADPSNGIMRFVTSGLTAADTYVFSASYHQTGANYIVPGTRMIFRYTNDNNYMSIEFRSGGSLVIGKIAGAEVHQATYTGFGVTTGAHEAEIDIISSPEAVTVYINGQLAFDNVAVPKGEDGNVLGAQVGFAKETVSFTADNLTLYATNDATIPENADIPKLPSAAHNLVAANTPISNHWGGGNHYVNTNGVVTTTQNLTDVYTFKDLVAATDTYIYSLDMEYNVQDDGATGWYRPEIVLRTEEPGDKYISVGFMSKTVQFFKDGDVYGTAYTGFDRGGTGKVHLDIISAPTSATLFINGVKVLEATGLPNYSHAWMGARSTYSDMKLSNLQIFKMPVYTIGVTAGANGTVSPAGDSQVTFGEDLTVTITPDADYLVEDVKVDGVSVGVVDSYTFEHVSANHTVAATFRPAVLPFDIIASAGENGSISDAGTTQVLAGKSKTYTITPAAGYEVSDVLVDGVSVGAVESYTFENVVADHTIAVTFRLIPGSYTVTATAGNNGSISPAGEVEVARDGRQTFTFTPVEGYEVADVLVDGVSVGAVESYTFENVRAAHTIEVSFSRIPAVPVLPQGATNLITPETATQGGTYENGIAKVQNGGSLYFDGVTGLTADDTFVFATKISVDKMGEVGWSGPRLYFRYDDTQNYLTAIITPGQVSIYGPVNGQDFGDWGPHRSEKFGCVEGDYIDMVVVSEPEHVSVYINGEKLIDRAEVPKMAPRAGVLAAGSGTVCRAEGLTLYKVTEDIRTEHKITATAGEGGFISPEGESVVFFNTGLTYTVTAKGGYEIKDVLVDGESVGAVESYTFRNIAADHTIEAVFEEIEDTTPAGTPIKITDLKGEDAGNYHMSDTGFRIPMQLWQHQYWLVTDPEQLPKSFYFKTTVNFQMIDEEQNYHGIRILLKSKDYENNFQVVWFLDGTFYPVGLVNNEYVDRDDLGFVRVPAINDEDSYELEISCVGDEFTFYVNGKKALQFTVPEEYRSYRTELGVQQSFVAFSFSDTSMVYGARPTTTEDKWGNIADEGKDDGKDDNKNETDNGGDVNTGVAFPAAACVSAVLSLAAVCGVSRKRREKGTK